MLKTGVKDLDGDLQEALMAEAEAVGDVGDLGNVGDAVDHGDDAASLTRPVELGFNLRDDQVDIGEGSYDIQRRDGGAMSCILHYGDGRNSFKTGLCD